MEPLFTVQPLFFPLHRFDHMQDIVFDKSCHRGNGVAVGQGVEVKCATQEVAGTGGDKKLETGSGIAANAINQIRTQAGMMSTRNEQLTSAH